MRTATRLALAMLPFLMIWVARQEALNDEIVLLNLLNVDPGFPEVVVNLQHLAEVEIVEALREAPQPAAQILPPRRIPTPSNRDAFAFQVFQLMTIWHSSPFVSCPSVRHLSFLFDLLEPTRFSQLDVFRYNYSLLHLNDNSRALRSVKLNRINSYNCLKQIGLNLSLRRHEHELFLELYASPGQNGCVMRILDQNRAIGETCLENINFWQNQWTLNSQLIDKTLKTPLKADFCKPSRFRVAFETNKMLRAEWAIESIKQQSKFINLAIRP